jgi:hypothetical protein
LGFEELFNKKLSKLFSNFSFAIFFILFTLFLCFLYLIISDHDAAIAFIKCPKAKSKSFTREIWLYDQTDFVKFNQMLTDINWNEKLCNFDDVDDMCEEFSKTFLQISSACIPSKKILIREKDKPSLVI